MSFERANSKAFKDEHRSTRRVSSAGNVDDVDSMGSGTSSDRKQDEVPPGNVGGIDGGKTEDAGSTARWLRGFSKTRGSQHKETSRAEVYQPQPEQQGKQ